jgi:phosphatidylserine/phosphatidylglycerophosphate/cardiolipin synthase-like enzyme
MFLNKMVSRTNKTFSTVLLATILFTSLTLAGCEEITTSSQVQIASPSGNQTANCQETVKGIYFCPEEQCKEQIITEISNAKTSIVVAIFSFTDDDLSAALIERHNAGIDVRILMEAGQVSKYSEQKKLIDAGIPVHMDTNSAYMHNKFIVIDSTTTLTGSVNYSGNGFNENNENLIIITGTGTAQRYITEFDRLFSEGIEWIG